MFSKLVFDVAPRESELLLDGELCHSERMSMGGGGER
jgi:hypothetical protein